MLRSAVRNPSQFPVRGAAKFNLLATIHHLPHHPSSSLSLQSFEQQLRIRFELKFPKAQVHRSPPPDPPGMLFHTQSVFCWRFLLVTTQEAEMSVTETSKKVPSPSQIIELDKATKLAEVWVNHMSEVEGDEPTDAGKEGRPPRLGLGAKVARKCKVGPSGDPVELKLYAKLEARKREAAQLEEESTSKRHGVEDDEGSVDEDSRSHSSMKKATPRLVLCPQPY